MNRAIFVAPFIFGCVAASTPTGAIVSAQFTCVTPCEENWSLGLTKTDVENHAGVPNGTHNTHSFDSPTFRQSLIH